MLVNCLIGRRFKAPRAVPIRAGPTTGMPMVILALDMAPLPSKPHRPAAEAGQLEVLFTPALPAAYAPPHVDTRGRTGGNAVPSPTNCAVKPGWSRVNLNHRSHLYRVVSAMAWGVGSSAAAPLANGNISVVTGSACRARSAFPRWELPGPGTARWHESTWLPCGFQRPMAAISEAHAAQTGRSLLESVLDFLAGLLQVAL